MILKGNSSDDMTLKYLIEQNKGGGGGGSGDVPEPATSTPYMNGNANVGTSLKYAREDHIHPKDTAKQDKLVSGTNIKTVNGTSLLGSGDVTVQEKLTSGTNIKTVNNTSLLGSGNVSVQAELVSGTNIKTVNSTSLLGSGDVAVQETLVSGTNIKTVNSNSLLGSGDVAVQETLVSGTNIKTVNNNSLLGSGNISISGTDLSTDLAVYEWDKDNISINATSYSEGSASIAKTGYTPIGVVGWVIGSASSNGVNRTRSAVYRCYISGTTLYWGIGNAASAAAKVRLYVEILYIKNS